jgi:hypothetical protein
MSDADGPVDDLSDDLLAVEDVRVFVPALDFAQSMSFYAAVGWTTVWTDDDGLAILELGGHRFMLQNFYVRDWADNFMITVVVRNAQAWFDRVTDVLAGGDFGDARVAEPKHEDWGATVAYAWDPSGVLLHFTQFD